VRKEARVAVITLTQVDNGKVIEAHEGDEIAVRLPQNVTTGYRWHIDRADGLALEQDEYQLEGSSTQFDPNTVFGRGGVRELRFRFYGPGRGRIELKNWQEWEGEASVTERFNAEFIPPP
jgi:predicted secreted protein